MSPVLTGIVVYHPVIGIIMPNCKKRLSTPQSVFLA
jgi:hypothetical protein